MTIKDNLHSLHNTHRRGHGRRDLSKVSLLNQGAQYMANQMAKYQWRPGDFGNDHRRPNGQGFETWWNSAYRNTWACCRKQAYAENLGWDSQTSNGVFGSQSSHGSCSSGCSNWTISYEHHRILSSGTYRRVGYGVAWDSRGRAYWVAHFTS